MLLDGLVGLFAAGASLDGFHEESRREEERKVVARLAFDDGAIDLHLAEYGEEGFEKTVDGQEGVGQEHATHDGAGDVAFVPLFAGKRGGHGEVTTQDHVEAVDALAGAGVHLVRHGGRADLARQEAFTG